MKRLLQFIRGFGIWFKVLISELASNVISVILVILLYFIFWKFPQTLDLLLVLNQNNAASFWEIFTMEVPLYFSLLLVIAFFIWNAPKYYYRENYNLVKFKNVIGFIPTKHYEEIINSSKYSYNCKHHLRKVLPKFLACFVLFMSAFGILNAMEQFGIKSEIENVLNPSKALLMTMLILALLLEFHFYNFIRNITAKIPRKNYFIFVTVTLLFGVIFVLGFVNSQSEKDLTLLFFSNIALAFIFFIVVFNSKNLLSRRIKPFFYGGIIVSGLFFIFIYIVFNIKPDISRGLNPISVILICLIALYTISFLLVFLGKKLRFPLFTFVTIFAFILAEYNIGRENFKHYTLDENVTSTYKQPGIKRYIYNWILSRKEKIMQAETGSYPVLFVSSEGGGSRAGLWSFLIHSYLSEKSNNKYYNDYLFSLTGASGGNVGNSLFFVTAQHAKENQNKINYRSNSLFKYKASELYAKNYLSSSIVGLLGRDLVNNVLGFLSFDNRGELLQNEWQKAHKNVFNTGVDYLDEDVHSLYNTQNTSRFVPPLLFLNSSHAQTGQYSVISPVDFSKQKSFSGYYDFMKELKARKGTNSSIKLSEAMRINAAFPYLTPAGEIKEVGVFGDAGYYDNIGGTVTLNLINVFTEVLNYPEFLDIKNKINLKNILINSDLDEAIYENNISQLKAPFGLLMNVRSGHVREQIEKLDPIILSLKRIYITSSTKITNSFQKKIRSTVKDTIENQISPILPLGRYLSGTAIKGMEAYLESDTIKSQLDSLLFFKTMSLPLKKKAKN